MSLPAPFQSPDALRAAFLEGLNRLLADDGGVGGYILALANAAQAPSLWQQLKGDLQARYHHHATRITAALREGRRLDVPEDDLLVFLKLMAMGFDAIGIAERRTAGPWEVVFNPLRALRPPRASQAPVRGIAPAFDRNGFHFNLPSLEPEVIWSGELLGRTARLLYNKFPFVEAHALLIPEPERELPQLLSHKLHGWAWEVTSAIGRVMPGFGLAYNSYGAHASVNHLHFQTFVRRHTLPVCSAHWTHNGGETAYPAHCLRFTEPLASWVAIDRLHARQIAYNLIYLPGALYLFPRRSQGSYTPPSWSVGHAWYEMAGGVVTFSREHYTQLDAAAIEAQLRHVSLS